MKEYVASNPNVEVRGQVILSTVNALGERAAPILAAHGLG